MFRLTEMCISDSEHENTWLSVCVSNRRAQQDWQCFQHVRGGILAAPMMRRALQHMATELLMPQWISLMSAASLGIKTLLLGDVPLK